MHHVPGPIWAMLAVVIFCLGGSVGASLPWPTETYAEAKVACTTSESSPWDVAACQWQAYEKFFGPEMATAAWENGKEKAGK